MNANLKVKEKKRIKKYVFRRTQKRKSSFKVDLFLNVAADLK